MDGLSVRFEEPLRRHTAWRTGGACEAFVVVHDPERLPHVIADCRAARWSFTLLGHGTRTVVRDGGMSGVVIRLGTGFSTLAASDETIDAGAAVPVPALLARSRALGLSGLESLSGVPGSLGASLALDTGPWESTVEHVRVLVRGRIREESLERARSRGRPLYAGARFRLAPAADKVIAAAIRKARVLPSSWYEAPKRRRLRPLLDNLQIPGVRLRSVRIPGVAPELLVNLGSATAADLDLLHRTVLERVHRDRGVKLTSRIRWAGRRTP